MMTPAEFNRHMRQLTSQRTQKLDIDKAAALDDDTKARLTEYIIEGKMAVLTALIGSKTDKAYLERHGYTVIFTNAGNSFLGTEGQRNAVLKKTKGKQAA